jgi:uncharacterized protein YbjT (DUF2867 family)
MKISVFGATGLVGHPATQELLSSGHEVRVVSRNARRASRFFGPGHDVAEADAEDGAGLERALEGCDGVLASISSPNEDRCLANLQKAAQGAGLKRLIYVSGCTVIPENDWFPLIAGKLAAERRLEEGEVPWTVLAPGWFFETLQRFVRDGRAVIFGDNPTPYHFVAAGDFGRIVRQAFENPSAENRRFVIHGPEGITIRAALERYCQVRHPEIKKVAQPPVWLLRTVAALKRNRMMKEALALMAYFEKVGELGDPTEANELFGAPATTLEDWLKD